jgi:hypothetical protein
VLDLAAGAVFRGCGFRSNVDDRRARAESAFLEMAATERRAAKTTTSTAFVRASSDDVSIVKSTTWLEAEDMILFLLAYSAPPILYRMH